MEGGANTTLDTCTDQTPCKLKLGGDADLERVGAVRAAALNARLVVDANEAWSLAQLRELGPALAELGAELIEQPLPASEALRSRSSPAPSPCGRTNRFTTAPPSSRSEAATTSSTSSSTRPAA